MENLNLVALLNLDNDERMKTGIVLLSLGLALIVTAIFGRDGATDEQE